MSHNQVNPAVWNTVADYMDGRPGVQFPKPGDSKIALGDMVPVPAVACTAVGDAQTELKSAGFTPVQGGQVASNCPAGTVADTRPSSMAPKYTAIVLEISKGPGGAAPPNPGNNNGGKKHGPGH